MSSMPRRAIQDRLADILIRRGPLEIKYLRRCFHGVARYDDLFEIVAQHEGFELRDNDTRPIGEWKIFYDA